MLPERGDSGTQSDWLARKRQQKILSVEQCSRLGRMHDLSGARVSNSVHPLCNSVCSVVAFELRSLSQRDRLSAMRAAPRVDGNLAQAFRTLPGCRISRGRSFAHPRNQQVHWRHHKEVNRHRNQQERNRCVDEVADKELAVVNGEANRRKIRLADQGCDEWSQQVSGKGRNHGCERRANDHANCHVHNISAQNELLESTEHKAPPYGAARVVRGGTKVNEVLKLRSALEERPRRR